MKVLVISDLYPPYYSGGYELNCKDSVEALLRAGHDVTVLTSTWGAGGRVVHGGIHRILLFDPTYLDASVSSQHLESAGLSTRFAQFRRVYIGRRNYTITRELARSLQPDVIFAWRLGHVTISPASVAQDLGIRLIIRLEDYSLARPGEVMAESSNLIKNWYRSMRLDTQSYERLREGSSFLVISQVVKDYYVKRGFAAQRMAVLPVGLPAETLRSPEARPHAPFAAPDGKIRLLFLGRLEPEKGLDIALEAIGHLKKFLWGRDIHLDIIGAGKLDYLEQLGGLTARLGISNQVTFQGKLDQEAIRARMQSYDAMLFPSRWAEPFGRVVVESMAQGLTVVASRSGAMPEIITDGVDGLLVPSNDPAAMAVAIIGLAREPRRASNIAKNAFETVRSRFTIEHTTALLEAYLCQIDPSAGGLSNAASGLAN